MSVRVPGAVGYADAWNMMMETVSWVGLAVGLLCVVGLCLLVCLMLFGGYSSRMRAAVLERSDRKPSTKTAERVGQLVFARVGVRFSIRSC